jgi:hypothetical protein
MIFKDERRGSTGFLSDYEESKPDEELELKEEEAEDIKEQDSDEELKEK